MWDVPQTTLLHFLNRNLGPLCVIPLAQLYVLFCLSLPSTSLVQ